MDNFMAIVPVLAIGMMAFLFVQFVLDVIRGKYRTEK